MLVSSAASADVGSAGTSTGSELPLQVGQRFGGCTIVAVSAIVDGAIDVTVKDADGHTFVLQILARDSSPVATEPPARTEGLAIFVRNGGDGWHPTDEVQGVTAMALAEAIVSAGHGAQIAGLKTHAERIVEHREMLIGDQRHLHWAGP